MGTTTGVYSLDVDGRIIDYPDDQSIKQAIAAAYGVDINEVKIEYAPYKITCADGWNDNNGQHDAGKACWHVDMTVSITTKNQASVVYHLWDANAANYDVVDSYMVDKGTQVRLPDELSKYPDNKGDYYFDGWYTNPERTGDKVRFPYTVNEATDFYAKYVYAPEVVIQYEVVGGGRVTNRKDTVKVNASEDAASGSGAIADKGYKFKGWYDNRDGNGNPLSVDEYFKPEKSPVGWEAATYYAVFEPDEGQTKELKATVDYVLGDEVQTEDHKDLTATVQILQPDTLSTQGVEAKEYKGWKLEKITINDKIVQNLPATVNNGDAVRYHYIIDEDQTKELKATVDYKLGAKVQSQDHKDLTATVQVLEPDTLSTEGVTANVYEGWKLVHITINGSKVLELPDKVNNGDKIIYHYLPDEEQTKELKATVDYVLGGEVQTEAHKDLTATVQILQPDTLSTQGVEAKEYKGWRLEKITINDKIVQNLPATVNNGDAVRYHYIIDEDQTKELKATVDYVLGNEVQTKDHKDLIATVQILEPDILSTEDVETKQYKGWLLEKITINGDQISELPQTVNDGDAVVYHYTEDENEDNVPDKYQVTVRYEAVNGTVTITEPVYVTIYNHTSSNEKELEYAEPGTEGAYGTLSKDQIADAAPNEGYDPATEQWKANGELAEKPTIETRITEDTTYEVSFGRNGYGYDVIKRFLNAAGEEVDTLTSLGTAAYGTNILEASGVKVLQEELHEGNLYELVKVEGADRLITNDIQANHVEVIYQQNAYVYDVVKRYLDANGNEVDAVFTGGTALYGQNILEASDVTVLQEELYEGNLYELVRVDGADRLITNDPNANRVEVIYQQNAYVYDVVKRYLDANGNEVNAVITGGTALYGQNILEASDVTVLQEELYEGNLYELVRVDGADRLITNDPNTNRVEVIYQQNAYVYDVVKRYLDANGNEVDAVFTGGTALYGQNILEASDVTVLQEELYEGNLYELVRVDGADRLITNDPNANRVEIIYQQKNYNYEVVKHYEGLNETAVESTKGTAPYGTGILEMSNVDVLQHETYKDHTYVLVKVDGADKLVTNDETQNRVDIYYALDEKGGTDPTDPTNPDGHPDKYQIIFRYVSADETMGTVSVTKEEVHTFTDEAGNYIDKYPISPNGATAQALEGFAFDYWVDTEGRDYTADMQNMKSQTYLEDTTFTAHFAEDKIGETDPENPDPNHPDNIPDYRQITFRYVSENPSYGTVSGTVVEVRTVMEVKEGENGYQVLETKSVNPFADVTVSANGRYSFERWSDGTTNFANTDEISAASFDADTTFTAYFDYNGGGSSGGGGGGGNGGGPSGSGGDSTGGPGVTVTIDKPEVPLAPAPGTGTGDVISINDGMVPMAPLPKTGQTTMRSTLLMAFSGILLAITGFSKKRKEEEN